MFAIIVVEFFAKFSISFFVLDFDEEYIKILRSEIGNISSRKKVLKYLVE